MSNPELLTVPEAAYCLQGGHRCPRDEAAVGADTSQATPKKPSEALGQDSKQSSIAVMIPRQNESKSLVVFRLDGKREAIDT
jgi:hypothetical protein